MNVTSVAGLKNSNRVPTSIRNKGISVIKSIQIAGTSTKKNNMFGFTAVTITDDVIRNIYGDAKINGPCVCARTAGSKKKSEYEEVDPEKVKAVELPEWYDKLKDSYSYYYHGKNISDYELIQTAVASGKMEMPPEKGGGLEKVEAFKVLVEDEASKKNAWSDTLYSEDGYYTFTTSTDGKLQMHLLDDEGVGASVEDIANWLMSGTPARNIESRYLDYLRTVDPDLYNAAMRIGSEVSTNSIMENLHMNGLISDKQNHYDMGLLGIMFGKNADDMRCIIHECRTSGNFLALLDLYQPEGAESLLNLRIKQSQETNGGII